jgi:hypothetical protein
MTTLYRPYCTLNNVKNHCGIALTKTDYDDEIRDAINLASRLIDSLTGRYYYEKTLTAEYLNGTINFEGWQILSRESGGLLLTPQGAPIISISELIEDTVTLVENTDFFIDKKSGIIEKNSANWNPEPRKIKITGVLGYDSADTATPSADIPGDIVLYAIELSARKSGHYKKAIKNYVSGGAESVDLFGVPKEIEAALKALRPVDIG